MFEHRSAPLLPRTAFLLRVALSLGAGLLIVACCLFIGMVGYRHFEGFSWTDAFLSAAMILSGMGPVGELRTEGGKLFAGCYALFSGLAFMTAMGVALAPAAHRFFHILNLEREAEA